MKANKDTDIKIYLTGQIVCEGVYTCKNCGQKIYVEEENKLPKCPRCFGDIWT